MKIILKKVNLYPEPRVKNMIIGLKTRKIIHFYKILQVVRCIMVMVNMND